MFAAANAAFRTSNPEAGDHKIAVERLDSVLQAYADVLRLDPSHVDAAYNYEYVARVRDAIAKGQEADAWRCQPDRHFSGRSARWADDAWAPRGPPPEITMGEFKTLTPMKFDEREEQTEPGRGTFQRRRG